MLVRPLLCGYYGENNIGDDALLQALLQSLPAEAKPCITAADQQQVQRQFCVDSCDRRSLRSTLGALGDCDGLILGGGSLLQDSTSWRSLLYYAVLIGTARLQSKPVILWAQGLGPLRRRRSRLLVGRLDRQLSWLVSFLGLSAGWVVAASLSASRGRASLI